MSFIKRGRGEILHDDPEQVNPSHAQAYAKGAVQIGKMLAEHRNMQEREDADEAIAELTDQRPGEEWD